jgi:alanine racemase
VFSFHTRIGLIKSLPAGQSVSYGRTYTLPADTRIGILCAGYGDGIPRSVSNRAEVLIRGQRCRVLGRITMDQTIVDLSALPDIRPGEEAVLVGSQGAGLITIGEFSHWADTIPWETLCSITKRVPRIYRTALGI